MIEVPATEFAKHFGRSQRPGAARACGNNKPRPHDRFLHFIGGSIGPLCAHHEDASTRAAPCETSFVTIFVTIYPQINFLLLSRKGQRSATTYIESFELSPDAERTSWWIIDFARVGGLRMEKTSTTSANTPLPMRAAHYVRMSTEQTQPENQLEVVRQSATSHNMEIAKEYSDHGRSGSNIAGRDGLNKLMSDVERKLGRVYAALDKPIALSQALKPFTATLSSVGLIRARISSLEFRLVLMQAQVLTQLFEVGIIE